MVCPKRHGRRSAPQEQSDWKKPSGRTEIRLFKTDHHVWNSLSSPRSSTCSLADDPEASVALDTRLNIGLRKLAKRIQDFVKAVTPQSQQTNLLPSQQRNQKPPIAGCPSDITQQRQSRRFLQQHVASETQASEISVKTRRNHVVSILTETDESNCTQKHSIVMFMIFS